jgi:hypothetical protein
MKAMQLGKKGAAYRIINEVKKIGTKAFMNVKQPNVKIYICVLQQKSSILCLQWAPRVSHSSTCCWYLLEWESLRSLVLMSLFFTVS